MKPPKKKLKTEKLEGVDDQAAVRPPKGHKLLTEKQVQKMTQKEKLEKLTLELQQNIESARTQQYDDYCKHFVRPAEIALADLIAQVSAVELSLGQGWVGKASAIDSDTKRVIEAADANAKRLALVMEQADALTQM